MLNLRLYDVHFFFRSIRIDINWIPDEDDCSREGFGHLEMIPASHHPFFIHRNAKGYHGISAFPCYIGGSRLGDIAGTAGAVHCDTHIPSHFQRAQNLCRGAVAASSTRSARHSVSEALDHPGNVFTIAVLAGHYNNPLVSKIVGRHEYPAVPKSQYQSLAGTPDRFQVMPILDLPAQSAADDTDDPISQNGNQIDFEAIDELQTATPTGYEQQKAKAATNPSALYILCTSRLLFLRDIK
jgi:hypothetical protein